MINVEIGRERRFGKSQGSKTEGGFVHWTGRASPYSLMCLYLKKLERNNPKHPAVSVYVQIAFLPRFIWWFSWSYLKKVQDKPNTD